MLLVFTFFFFFFFGFGFSYGAGLDWAGLDWAGRVLLAVWMAHEYISEGGTEGGGVMDGLDSTGVEMDGVG